jgi:hypothetical protein
VVGGVAVMSASIVFFGFLRSLPNPEDVVHDTDSGPTDPLVGQ